ncbi:cobyrinate a,c-diamide synthase [Chenggangzhangella methanolivorans]|uniref:cobyrinate a,c-diamide synthase n=1 Tax=Chenggangzhangella methanolivorans TaxID=1437009 RepID=UPI003623F951
MTPSFVVAAPSSGSGKTILTLGLLGAFRRAGLAVASAKIGPDYIDPRFHEAATGRPSPNLDGWSMRRDRLLSLAHEAGQGADVMVVEGVMGLFDRAAERGVDGYGGAAEVAKTLGLPVVLVIDVGGMAQSAGAVAAGFRAFDPDVEIAGVILNRVASARHAALSQDGCAAAGFRVFGAVPRTAGLATPSRHLGLVQAEEIEGLASILDAAAGLVADHVDLPALRDAARPLAAPPAAAPGPPARPLGSRIALACDVAFRFAYPHLLDGWRRAGAEIMPFSPLDDEAPPVGADAVFLPGGYPELHAGRLAAAARFRDGMRAAAANGVAIYGECGGYMTLGEAIIDADGVRHEGLGLLALETSFSSRHLHLGYRRARLAAGGPLGPSGTDVRAHEFHYATILREEGEEPLFRLQDGGRAGLRRANVSGSFLHVLDCD